MRRAARFAVPACTGLLIWAAIAAPVAVPTSAQQAATATPTPTVTSAGKGESSDRPLCEEVRPANTTEKCGSLPGTTPEAPQATPGSSTASLAWRDALKLGLADFDLLHAEYVANPATVKETDWTSRFKVVYLAIYRAAYRSGRDTVVYYARCLEDEYLRGIVDNSPLLVSYGLQARERLGEYADGIAPGGQPTPARR